MTKRQRRWTGAACALLGLALMAVQMVAANPWQLGVLVGLALFMVGGMLFSDRPRRERPFDWEVE